MLRLLSDVQCWHLTGSCTHLRGRCLAALLSSPENQPGLWILFFIVLFVINMISDFYPGAQSSAPLIIISNFDHSASSGASYVSERVPLLQTTLIDALQVTRLHQSSKQKEKSYTQNKVLTERAFWCAVPWPCPEYLFVVPKRAPQNRRQTVLPRSRRPRDSLRRSQTAQRTVKGRRGWEWRRTSLQRRWGGCRGTGWPNAWSERQPWKESMHLAFKVQQKRCTWQNHILTLHP